MRPYYAVWVDEYRTYEIFKISVERNNYTPFMLHVMIWRLNLVLGIERKAK